MLQLLAAIGIAAVFVTVILALLHLLREVTTAINDASRSMWP